MKWSSPAFVRDAGRYDLHELPESDQSTVRFALRDDDTKRGAAVVERFLEQGLKANAVDGDGGATLLMLAANHNSEDIARLLMDRGADLNATAEGCPPPLWWAASGGHVEIVRLLLERGADVDPTGFAGRTALDQAEHVRSLTPSRGSRVAPSVDPERQMEATVQLLMKNREERGHER